MTDTALDHAAPGDRLVAGGAQPGQDSPTEPSANGRAPPGDAVRA
jgi:hypothetical protein